MWFGTVDYSRWVPTPLRGADVSAQSWGESGTYQNGGGFATHAFNSHKQFNFSWKSSSSREIAQTMMSFYSGSFGRGKLYLLDPLTLKTNVFPARWADPSITCDFEGESLVPGLDPIRVRMSGTEDLQLPVFAAQYQFRNFVQQNPATVGVYIPVPPGHYIVIRGFSDSDLMAGPDQPAVRVEEVFPGGTSSGTSRIVPGLDPSTSGSHSTGAIIGPMAPGAIGVRVWIGGAAEDEYVSGDLTVHALTAEIVDVTDPGTPAFLSSTVTHWYGGQGSEGVRFLQPPTYINMTGVDGGQIEFSATFTEVDE